MIECKAPQIEVEQAVSQSIRNQNDDYIPKLFIYSQLVLALNKNSAMYATTGTAAKFWSVWKEPQLDNGEREFEKLAAVLGQPLAEDVVARISTTFDVQKQAVNEIDDYLYDELKTERGIELSLDQMDGIIAKVLQVAKHRSYK